MKRFALFFAFLVFVGLPMLQAQTVQITGTITSSEDGNPVPGVSVVVKGTTIGTTTDFDGKYSLNVPSGTTSLVFSFVGLKTQEVIIGGRNSIDVVMETDVVGLEEVVVTALGISREKKSLGYSVQDVKGDEITKARESNIVNSLSGKIAGVQITSSSGAVGASSRIVIRGVTSLSGNNQPLFIVDGIPINNGNFGDTETDGVNRGNGAADINPNDIENVSVLKGPNAAALYGSRASNGVVLITTKSGKSQKGLGVDVSNTTTFSAPLRLPNFQNKYGQGSNGQFEFVDGAGHGTNDGVDESWGPKLDAGLLIPQFNSPIDEMGNRIPTPWISHPNNIKDFFETGINSTTSVAITGGNDKSNVRASYTYSDEKGMVPNTNMNKNSLAINATVKPTDKLSLTTIANYVNSHSDNLPGYGYSAQNVMQQFFWFGRQVDLGGLKNYRNKELGFTDDYGTKYNWNYNYHNNPYFTLHENLNPMDRERLVGSFKLDYKFNDWLSAFVRTGGDTYTNTNSGRIARGDMDNLEGSFYQTISTYREINTDFLISANRNITELLSFNLNAGGNRMDRYATSEFGSADELAVGGVYTINNSKVPIRSSNAVSKKRINSLFFSGQFAYRNAIYLDFTGRNDWSSTLPDGNNSYFYPSVSASVVLSELMGLNSNVLSLAKIRGSWSKVGSDTDPYQLLTTVEFGDGWNASTKAPNLFIPNRLPNGDLQPQFINSWEVGAELSFFQNRVSLNAAYYNSIADGQILEVPISGASGFLTKMVNAGKLENNGIEVQLGLKPVATTDFEWNITFNYSKNNNKLTDLPEGVENYQIGSYWSLNVLAEKDQPYGSLFGYDFERDPNGNIIHVDGIPVQGSLKTLGNFSPDWIGGVNNEFRYKNLSLGFLIDAKMGGDIYSMTTTWGRYAGVLEETLIGREGGIVGDGVMEDPSNPGTYIPNNVVVGAEAYNKAAFSNTLAWSSVFDGSYIKFRELRVGYTIRKIGNFPIKDINLSVVGRNLAILYSNAPHIDPESSFSNTNLQGLEFGQLPSAKSLGFNISFKF
jgi:TonB-linked SusC/RagA family outer membrane protein